MASVIKRGKTWRIRWYGLDGRERHHTVRTAEAANRIEREIDIAHDAGREWEPAAPRERVTLLQVAERYQDARRLRVRAATLRNEGAQLDVALREMARDGVKHLDDLSRPALDDLLARLMRPDAALHGRARKPETASRIVEAMRALWQWAADSERWEGVPRVPSVKALMLPSSRPAPVVAPTWAEMDAMIEACRGWHKRLATWLRFTGWRAGESMALLWTDIDWSRGTATLRPETEKQETGRTVPLSPHLLDEIATWGKREGYVIPCARAAGVREREARGRDATRAWTRAGVREPAWRGHPWHAFRAGWKSGLLAAGADRDAVDWLQGHTLGAGSRGRYIDPSALPLRETVAMVPAVGWAAGNVVPLVGAGQNTDRNRR